MANSSNTSQAAPSRGLAAIMFTDIAGYTALMGRDEHKAIRALAQHRELVGSLVARFNGRVIGDIGDGTLSSFQSAIDALHCARAVQSALTGDPELTLRIGIHVGDVVFAGGTVLGDGVNVASRIHALAPPGGVCISERVFEEIRNKPEFQVKDLGEQNLKNVTRPLRAYALVVTAGSPAEARPTSANAAVEPSGKRRRLIFAGVGALLIGTAIVFTIASLKWLVSVTAEQSASAVNRIRSIAVLPLENLSGDASQEFFADGMTEELTTELAKINALRVISHTSVMRYKGERRKSLPEIAKELNVDGVVEGSVLRIGDKVRITTQLVDAPADKHIWAQSYERDAHDVLAMQDEVASAIAREIDVHLTPQEQAGFSNAHQVSPEAHEAYLKGIFYWHLWTEEGWKKSIEYLEQAVKADPDFAAAYGALARSYADAAETFAPSGELMPKAKAAAEKALALDPSNAEAHTALGVSKYYYEFDRPGAEREFQRAIAEHPAYSEAHHHYGYMLSLEGRNDESLAQYRKARELDPFSFAIAGDMTVPLTVLEGPEKAFEHARRLVEMDPNNWEGRFWLGVAYMTKGQIKEGIAEFEAVNALFDNPFSKANLGYWVAVSGNRDRARKLLDELERESKVRFVSPYYFAWIHLGLRENDPAVEALVKSYDVGSTRWLMLLKQGQFDPLRSDPRFQELLKKVHLDK